MVLSMAPLWLASFRRLLSAYALAELAWGLSSIALTVLVYERTGNSLGPTALFLAAMTVPALAAPALTARLEALPPRWALASLYVAQAVTFGLLAAIAGRSPLVLVLVLAFVDGAAGLAARALARATVAAILEPRGLLREGNAITNIAFGVLYMTAPALGGLAVAEFGARTTLALTGGCFAVMSVLLATAPELPEGHASAQRWRARTRAALQHVRERPLVRRLLGGYAAALVFFTLIVPIEIVYAGRSLHGGPGAYGALLSAWGAGSLLGGLLYARLRRRELPMLVCVSTAVVGVGYLAMALAPDVPSACACAAFGGLGNGIQFVALVTLVQESIAADFHARVLALLESMGAAIPGLAFVLGGALTAATGPRAAFAVAGTGAIGVGIVLAVRLRTAPSSPPQPPPRSELPLDVARIAVPPVSR